MQPSSGGRRFMWAALVLALGSHLAYGQTTTDKTTEQNAPFDAVNECNGDNVAGEGRRVSHVKINQNQVMVTSNHNGQGIGFPSGLKYSFGQKAFDKARTASSFVIFRTNIRLVSGACEESGTCIETPNTQNFFETVAVKVHKDGRTQGSMEPQRECRGN